ncbi:tripartite tricarboxylate transporter TctB family protein [Halomonas sp. MC140]|nr:tripartite tricarboxylate transporter TctB family protein [Halomonas sp. MC140]MDN7131164.1 tripartite tricarboxylate transporter TctB family protein [Halomonas sp. MC140]
MGNDIGKPLFNLFLLIASASAFIAATEIPNYEIAGDLSPAFFPKMLSVLIFLCAIPCLIKDSREWYMARSDDSQTTNALQIRSVSQWLLIIVLILGYIYAFERLGYIPSTLLFAFCCVMGLIVCSGVWNTLSVSERSKSIFFALIFAAALAVGIFYVFTQLFKIPLPT